MRACERRIGRVFEMRLEDGDVVLDGAHEVVGVGLSPLGEDGKRTCISMLPWGGPDKVVRTRDKQSGFELLEPGSNQRKILRT